jgi:hypothetical protein
MDHCLSVADANTKLPGSFDAELLAPTLPLQICNGLSDFNSLPAGSKLINALSEKMPECDPAANTIPHDDVLSHMLDKRDWGHALVLLDRDTAAHGPCGPDQAFLHMTCTTPHECKRSFLPGNPPGTETHRYTWLYRTANKN